MTEVLNPRSLRLRRVYNYWANLKDGDRPPKRKQLDPLDLGAAILPYLILIDVVNDGEDFRYRLVGSALALAAGCDFTGKTVREFVQPEKLSEIIESYERCLKTGQICCSFGDFGDTNREFIQYERLVLPLCNEDGKICQMLVAFELQGEYSNATAGTYSQRVYS